MGNKYETILVVEVTSKSIIDNFEHRDAIGSYRSEGRCRLDGFRGHTSYLYTSQWLAGSL